jgi:transposase
MKNQPKKRKKFDRKFKLQVVSAMENGKSAAEVAREFEVHETLIYRWLREYKRSPQDAFQRKSLKDPSDKKIGELERMVGRLHMENDILKKATKILGESLQNYRKQRSETQ